MLKKIIAALLLTTQTYAATPTKDLSHLASFQLIQLAKGYEAAQINATDVYSAAYDIRSLNSIRSLKKYAEKMTGADLQEAVVTGANKKTLAYDIAESLMTGDGYSTPDLSGIGQLIQPLQADILGHRNIRLFWGSSSEEEFYASHSVVVVFDTDTKEALVLTVGYSE